MATPGNRQIITRGTLRRLGINIDDEILQALYDDSTEEDDDNVDDSQQDDASDQPGAIDDHPENIVIPIIPNDDIMNPEMLRGLRSLALSLPKFDGITDIQDWFQDFDRYSTETGRTTEDNKLYDLISHLTGEARQWFTLQPTETKQDYETLRTALEDKYKLSAQEKLDIRGQIYTMRQGPLQSFKEFATSVQLKAKSINLEDAEVVGICINGARPSIKAHLAMAQPASMKDLMKLPVVVTEIPDNDSGLTMSVLKDIQEKMNSIAMVQNIDNNKHVRFEERRSASRSPSGNRRRQRSDDHYTRQRSDDHYRGRPATQQNNRPRFHTPRNPYTAPYIGPPASSMTRMYRPQQNPRFRNQGPGGPQQTCGKCFTRCQGEQLCPAFNKQCFRCNNWHHFKIACRSRPYSYFNGQQ